MHVELAGRDVSHLVRAGSISIRESVGERATAQVTLRLLEGESIGEERFAVDATSDDLWVTADGSQPDDGIVVIEGEHKPPEDWLEVTIDRPGLPYRALALRLNPISYWALDDADRMTDPSSQVLSRLAGTRDLSVDPGQTGRLRAWGRGDGPTPYGACPRFTNTSGSAVGSQSNFAALPTESEFSIALLARLDGAAAGGRSVVRTRPPKSADRTEVTWTSAGVVTLTAREATASAAASVGAWHHFAVVARTGRTDLYIDGKLARRIETGSLVTVGETFNVSGATAAAPDLGVAELGLWDRPLDAEEVAALWASRASDRLFGGYVQDIDDRSWRGAADHHEITLPLAGYGVRLDRARVSGLLAAPAGKPVFDFVRDVLDASTAAGLSTAGVTVSASIKQVVTATKTVSQILRDLGREHAAAPVVDRGWPIISMSAMSATRASGVRLSSAAGGNVAEVRRRPISREFCTRVRVIGRALQVPVFDRFVGDGTATSWNLSATPERVLSITVGNTQGHSTGNPSDFAGLTIDKAAKTVSYDGIGDGNVLIVRYLGQAENVAIASSASEKARLGFDVEELIVDDALDTPAACKARADAELARRARRPVTYHVTTIFGRVADLRAGDSVETDFPKFGEQRTMFVDDVETELGLAGFGVANTVLRLRLTPLGQHELSAGDDWRRLASGQQLPE